MTPPRDRAIEAIAGLIFQSVQLGGDAPLERIEATLDALTAHVLAEVRKTSEPGCTGDGQQRRQDTAPQRASEDCGTIPTPPSASAVGSAAPERSVEGGAEQADPPSLPQGRHGDSGTTTGESGAEMWGVVHVDWCTNEDLELYPYGHERDRFVGDREAAEKLAAKMNGEGWESEAWEARPMSRAAPKLFHTPARPAASRVEETKPCPCGDPMHAGPPGRCVDTLAASLEGATDSMLRSANMTPSSLPRPALASDGPDVWVILERDLPDKTGPLIIPGGHVSAYADEDRGRDAASCFPAYRHYEVVRYVPAARAEALERDLSATIQAAAMREVTLRDNANRLDTEQRLRWAATQQRDEALERVREVEAKLAESEAHVARMCKSLDLYQRELHPLYGPCDALAENGECSVCREVIAAGPEAAAADMRERAAKAAEECACAGVSDVWTACARAVARDIRSLPLRPSPTAKEDGSNG